ESEPYASAAHTTEKPSRSASCANARWSAGVVHAVWYPRLRPSRMRPPVAYGKKSNQATPRGVAARAGRVVNKVHPMQQRPLGRSGLAVSRLALGTMTWGRDTDPDDAAAQLKTYLDAGGILLDTADVYADGEAEALIGSLLGTLVSRDEILIATKAGMRPDSERRRDGSRGHLLRALDASLRRLGTDYVDIWMVHGYDPDTPLEETLSALDHAVSSGKARYVGISNFSGWQTAQAATWQAAWPGRAPLVCAQLEYSLLERGIEREAPPACLALGLGMPRGA